MASEHRLPVSLRLSHTEPQWPETLTAPALLDQVMALRRRWRLIALVSLLVPGLTGIALLKMPTRYTATGILLYDPADAAPPGSSLEPGGANAADEDAITASQAAIITSLPAVAALVARLGLTTRPEFNAGLRHPSALARLLAHLQSRPAAALSNHVVLAAQQALAVNVLPGSRILSVSFTSRDPALAAAGANLTMQLYLEHQRAQSFADLSDAQSWLEGNALTLQTQLDRTETELVSARAAAGIIPGAQANLTTEAASRITASLVDAQAGLAMAQARLSSAANGDAAAANAAIAPSLQPLRKEQADLSAQVQSLEDQYGADYPELVAARTSLAAIDSEIAAETGRELDAAQAEVAADRAQVASISSALNGARAESEAQDVEATPIRALEQHEDAERAMLRSVTLQADQLAQQSALTKPDGFILSEASAPETPSSPRHALVLGAALALGFFLGLMLAGLADALDTSFRSGGELRRAVGLGCLALVPEIRAPRDAPITKPFSVFSEQMRALRTGLGLAAVVGAGSQVIAITAARPDEGKTTLTIALARALALSGLRVIAIDGDIRQPSFDAIFYTLGAPGLTDHLSGLSAMHDVILQDRRTELSVIGAGTQVREALSLFLSPRLPAMLAQLRNDYDVILIDVPPAFALAEARVLAGLADSTLLCVRWGKTPRRVVRAAITLLCEAGVNLAGVALTRVDAVQHGRSGFPDAEIYQPRYGGYFRS
jgi:capsular exopolysaccharide synthesis family protein